MKIMKESPLFWPAKLRGNTIQVLDETVLPFKEKYIRVNNTQDAVTVIKTMRTRAFGQFLVVLNTFLLVLKNNEKGSQKKLSKEIRKTAKALNLARPTFPFKDVTGIVLHWLDEAENKKVNIAEFLQRNIKGFLDGIKHKRLKRVLQIADRIKTGQTVLTHCNVSGELAMAAALCKKQGKDIHFFATETRPYFQGARLTCWELSEVGADVTLLTDNAVGTLFQDGLIDCVIVGSDRSCANGDIANKIGTYQIAVLAREFNVPFYVLTQPSQTIKKGKDIPIEIRDPNELLKFNKKRIFNKQVRGFYPGFDIVPKSLITQSIPIDVH